MELRFEPCVLNLIWKYGTKDPQKRGDHLIIFSFGIKGFTIKKNIQKNKILMFEFYNLIDPMD
jgi:hypothetical protein